MKQVKMTLPDYPMFMYFMNMFNNTQPPSFYLWLDGPTTETITFTLHFTDMTRDPDLEALHRMFAASGGTEFSVSDAVLFMGSQTTKDIC